MTAPICHICQKSGFSVEHGRILFVPIPLGQRIGAAKWRAVHEHCQAVIYPSATPLTKKDETDVN